MELLTKAKLSNLMRWSPKRPLMFDLLRQTLAPLVPLNAREQAQFEGAFIFRQVPKKFILVEQDQVAHEMVFINRGLIRLFYRREGDDFTGFLFQEGLFASSYESMITQTPSRQVLETLEPCDLLVMPAERLMRLYETMPKMNLIARKLIEQRFLNAQRIFASFVLDSPEQRYRDFSARHPDLLQRVPQHIIASFLGVTPVSLSRIRKRIAAGD